LFCNRTVQLLREPLLAAPPLSPPPLAPENALRLVQDTSYQAAGRRVRHPGVARATRCPASKAARKATTNEPLLPVVMTT